VHVKKALTLGLALSPLLLAQILPPPFNRSHQGLPSEVTSAPAQRARSALPGCLLMRRVTAATPSGSSSCAALLTAVESESDPDQKNDALDRLVNSVPDADLPTLVDALARDPRPSAADLRQLLVRRWAENDAPATAAWAEQLEESSLRRTACEQIAIAWANADLPAATAWVQALADGDSKATAALSLAYEASRSEPVTALDVAGALPSGPQRDDLLVHAISQWAVGDWARAADWAAQVPDAVLRERLLAAVSVSAAEKDGAAAAAYAVQVLAPGEEQDRAAVCIVQLWAQYSPSAAASWVQQWPENLLREAASQSLSALIDSQNSSPAH
jgi:hypothetical protein